MENDVWELYFMKTPLNLYQTFILCKLNLIHQNLHLLHSSVSVHQLNIFRGNDKGRLSFEKRFSVPYRAFVSHFKRTAFSVCFAKVHFVKTAATVKKPYAKSDLRGNKSS